MYGMKENICKAYISKGLVSNICKQLSQLNNNNNKPGCKMGKRPQQTFLRRKHADYQQVYEKIFSITNYQENST